MLFQNIDSFKNIYFAVDEIEKKIIADDQIFKKNEQIEKDKKEGKVKT